MYIFNQYFVSYLVFTCSFSHDAMNFNKQQQQNQTKEMSNECKKNKK